MFSKAKLKRFNEEVGCAPPPTAYNPKNSKGQGSAVSLDKSDRWQVNKEVTPGPGTYTGQVVTSPTKHRSTSSSRLNSSTCSSTSTASGSGFLSPPKPDRLQRSRSMRSVQPHKGEKELKVAELENQIKSLTEERNTLKHRISELEKQLEEVQRRISSEYSHQDRTKEKASQDQKEKYEAELKSAQFTLDDNEAQMESLNSTITALTQQNEYLRSLLENGDKSAKEEIELHKQIDAIRNELTESQHYILTLKDERSGLQLKLRELEESAEKHSMNEDELHSLKDHLEHLTVLRDNLETTARVKDDLIAELRVQLDEVVVEGRSYHEQMEHYRSRMEQLEEELQSSFIDRDEAESTVRGLVAKYEALMKDQIEEREIQREILAKKDIEIELLNASLSNLSMKVTKLEETLQELEKKLREVKNEKELVEAKLNEEKKNTEELSERINTLEVQIKEKEVVQQFLEKEISSREAELSQRLDEASVLHERVQTELDSRLKMEEDLSSSEKKVSELDKELASVKEALMSRDESLACVENKMTLLEDNNRQLEEKVVELMAEISDREAQHIAKVRSIESDLEDIGVKYSESLLEHEATRRVLTQTLEEVEKEKLLRTAAESDIQSLNEKQSKLQEEKETLEHNMKDLVQKYTSLEDALACEEAENRDLEERLEREVSLAKEAAATAQKEFSSLKTSNEGFCTQITQLKIDMRKKSQAVDENQLCIDALREEKQHLTTLRDNLEKTLETKEETIAKLHLQASTLEREMEEERVTLRSRIGDLENHLKETQKEHEMEKKKVKEIEEKLLSLEEENLHLSKSYEKQLEEKTIAETKANAKLEELSNKYVGYEDQVKNLQTSLFEKTKEFDCLQDKYTATNSTLDGYQEEMKVLETSVKRFKREIEAMNKTLASKDSSLDSLNMTLGTKSEEVQSLYKTLEDKQVALLASESRVQQLEEVEEKLIKDKDTLAISLSSLKDELSEVKSQVSRMETTFIEEKSVEISQIKSSHENEIDELKSLNQLLQGEAESWKSKFEYLEKMIEPFRAQLDSYEVEKASLLSRSSAAKEEVDKLSKQYATLLGHQNHKQKIQHVLKLKTENNELREDVYKLRQETERQRKTIRRLEEKMHKISGSTTRLNETVRSMDKENSFYGGMGSQVQSSTPLKPSNKPHRI